MLDLKCAVCGAKKGEANRWWVLFQADSNQAALISSMEEAETLQQWREQATRFHLCGEECLYRKLSGMLMRSLDRPLNRTHLAQPLSPQNAVDERGSDANSPIDSFASKSEDGSRSHLSTLGALRRTLGPHHQ